MPLGGRQMLRLFVKEGWILMSTRGSHVKLGKGCLRETIPMHRELALGLEQKLLKRLSRKGGERR
jgi:predicted RNA binding protein YcfA (HicA-like mRNA interferase family)